MHYRILAILEEPSIDGLAGLMEPYGDGREWDFYQVGGRYAGFFDGYDPEKDPINQESCQYHKSPDCPCCKGTGTTVKWPTRWAPRHTRRGQAMKQPPGGCSAQGLNGGTCTIES